MALFLNCSPFFFFFDFSCFAVPGFFIYIYAPDLFGFVYKPEAVSAQVPANVFFCPFRIEVYGELLICDNKAIEISCSFANKRNELRHEIK